jgi:type II secretory pathway pseudopilin PulG
MAGFAYLWTLLLVAFMGIGLTVAAEVHTTSARRSQERALLNVGHQFRTAIQRYYESALVAGQHQYPASLEDLLRDNRVPGIQRHLRQVFVDPMTGKAEWGVVRVAGRIVGVYSLSEQVPVKVDNFDAEDMAFRGKKKYSEWVFTYPVDLLLRDPAKPAVPGQGASAPFMGASEAASSPVGTPPGGFIFSSGGASG